MRAQHNGRSDSPSTLWKEILRCIAACTETCHQRPMDNAKCAKAPYKDSRLASMGSGVGRVNKHKGSNKRARRKRTLARAIDQIHDDLADPMKAEALRSEQPIDFDLPGMGQHYCLECARFFIDADVLVQHTKTKLHKNRLKELKEKPYSQAEAEAASGMAPNDRGM
jgi:bud site selection protein 20